MSPSPCGDDEGKGGFPGAKGGKVGSKKTPPVKKRGREGRKVTYGGSRRERREEKKSERKKKQANGRRVRKIFKGKKCKGFWLRVKDKGCVCTLF